MRFSIQTVRRIPPFRLIFGLPYIDLCTDDFKQIYIFAVFSCSLSLQCKMQVNYTFGPFHEKVNQYHTHKREDFSDFAV